MRVYEALETYVVGPRTLQGMINIFKVVLKKEILFVFELSNFDFDLKFEDDLP